MKNKNAMIISVIVLIVVLGGGFLLVKNLTKPVAENTEEASFAENLPPVDSSVSVNLEAKGDNTAVVLSVSNIPQGTESIEYELSYNNEEGLPKGALGKIDLDGKQEIVRDILLGTCSKNVCTYDKGVTSVNLVLKFNHPDGASQFTKEYPLSS